MADRAGWGYPWGGPATNTGYATVLIPAFRYYSEIITISSTNNTLVFRETAGVDLTATLASGTWSWGELAYKIKVALEAAGVATYTVTYSHTTRKFTISSDLSGGATVFQNRTGGTNDAWDDIGFTSNQTGASSYTSDTAVPSLTTLTCTQRIRGPQLECEADREDTYLETGRRESCFYGARERYTFRLEHETYATAQGLNDMWNGAGRYGIALRFFPDSTDMTTYLDCYWDAKVFRPIEMTSSMLYRLYTIEIALIVKVPVGSGSLKARDFLDRRPSS